MGSLRKTSTGDYGIDVPDDVGSEVLDIISEEPDVSMREPIDYEGVSVGTDSDESEDRLKRLGSVE